MGYTDRLTAEAHLQQAVRHLATAEAVVRSLDADADLTSTDHHELTHVVDQAHERLATIAEALAGRGFQREAAALFRELSSEQDRGHFH